MELHNLKPLKGSRKSARRIGRGESSGAGKTSGRGGKGQTARKSGPVRKGFEGGQMPLYRRVPKLGFRSRMRTSGENQFNLISLSDLERFDAGSKINYEVLVQAGLSFSPRKRAGVKLLNNGTLTKALHLEIEGCSASAKAKIESLGGSVVVKGKEEPTAN